MKLSNDVVCSSHPVRLIAGIVFLVFMLAAIPAFSASFDCAKARSRSEKIVCADPALSHLDEELSRRYVQAKETSADKQALTQEQRLWITSERDKCSDAACMIQAYKARMMQLDKALLQKHAKPEEPNETPPENSRVLPSGESQSRKVSDAIQPDPVKWAEIERWLKKRQNDFIAHLDSAKKLELSKVREPFPWQVDWPAVETWCESITKGLEERRIKFPEPSAAVLHNGCQGVRNAVNTAFPACGKWRQITEKMTPEEEIIINEEIAKDKIRLLDGLHAANVEYISHRHSIDKSIDFRRDRHGVYWFRRLSDRDRFQQSIVDNACKRSNTWMYLFPGAAYVIEDTVLTKTDSRRITDAITPIYGEVCPSEEGLVFDEMSVAWLTEGDVHSYFPSPQVVLMEVAGEPVIAVFGYYSTADPARPPYNYNYKHLWQEMNKCKGCSPGAFTSTGDSNVWKQVPGYPDEPPFRWGVPGQGFVMINGVKGNNIWHSPWTRMPPKKIMDVIGDYPVDTVTSKYLSEWQTGFLHACIINFDHK